MKDNFYLYLQVINSNYHLENIGHKQAESILANSTNYFNEDYEPEINHFIITDDKYFSLQFLPALNEDEIKLSSKLDYDSRKIRVSQQILPNLSREFYEIYCKVRDKIKISHTFNVDKNINDSNYKFYHLPTPEHYKNIINTPVLTFEYLKEITLQELNGRFDIELLYIGDETYFLFLNAMQNPDDYYWEYKNNDILKYFDKRKKINIYISLNKLKEIKNLTIPENKEINLLIKTNISNDLFIEYHITDFNFIEKDDKENVYFSDDNVETNEEWIENNFDDDDIDTVLGNLD